MTVRATIHIGVSNSRQFGIFLRFLCFVTPPLDLRWNLSRPSVEAGGATLLRPSVEPGTEGDISKNPKSLTVAPKRLRVASQLEAGGQQRARQKEPKSRRVLVSLGREAAGQGPRVTKGMARAMTKNGDRSVTKGEPNRI